MSEYLIPAHVVARWEIAPGIGMREMATIVPMVALGVAVGVVLRRLGLPLAAVGVVGALPAGVAVASCLPTADGRTLRALALALWQLRSRPADYPWVPEKEHI